MRWIVWIFLMAVVVLGSLLIASHFHYAEAGFRSTGGSRSFSAPSRSYTAPSPSRSYQAPSYNRPSYTPPPRTNTYRETTTIIQQAPSSGGWFAPFAGALGGSWLGSWLGGHSSPATPPTQPAPVPPQPQPTQLPPCSPALPVGTPCMYTQQGVPLTPPFPVSPQSGQELKQQLQQQVPGAQPGTTKLPGDIIKVQ